MNVKFCILTQFRPEKYITVAVKQRGQVNHKLEKVALTALYCHLRPPDAIAFPA